ncbi:hypothetical protein [Mycobacterium intracellulare]|uniref:hypothetical protein n=1 Tax=Mycobacterium intracellulare TaxID=1767 RepID=UPI0014453A83|nr:hypothetical protein [Mycobacterium intracellulare]
MNITIALDVFRRIPTIGIHIDLDPGVALATAPAIDGWVKRISRRWVRHMAS